MSCDNPKIHPTAVIDPSAQIARDVEIGPLAVIEADTQVASGCVIHSGAVIKRWSTLGENNTVCDNAVIGGAPQDYGHDPKIRSFVQIGSGNVFREGVTINRATGEDKQTVIGNDNYFMTCAHVAHNCHVADGCIMTNGAAMGGHGRLDSRAILSANVLVHQHCWIGTGVMSAGGSVCNMHVPPFCMLIGTNTVTSLNRVGLRRAGAEAEDRKEVDEAFKIFFKSSLPAGQALDALKKRGNWGKWASVFVDFIDAALNAEPPHNRGVVKLFKG